MRKTLRRTSGNIRKTTLSVNEIKVEIKVETAAF